MKHDNPSKKVHLSITKIGKVVLQKPIPIMIQPYVHGSKEAEDKFVAEFSRGIFKWKMFGNTQDEAVHNLKDIIMGSYYTLLENEGNLGRGAARELKILKSFIG
jgi:hypothetical protein